MLSILVIEDNQSDTRLLKAILDKGDFDITWATSRRDGVNLIAGGGFDVIISDVMLKNGFGWNTIQSITDAARVFSTPVIVMTGAFDFDNAQRAIAELGVYAYADKNVMLAQKHPGLHPLLRIIAESIARASHIAAERAIAVETITRLRSERDALKANLSATITDSAKRQEILATANNAQAVELAEWRKVSQPKTWLTKNRITLITSTITAVVAVVVAMMAKC